jgi:predicted kinase
VRPCHGDLHLRNIVLLDGRPTLFDGVEFNDDIACTDVAYDLSFLLMDLWRRRLPGHANTVWNRFLNETDDVSAIPLLPLFLSCRAAVRAKTNGTAAGMQSDPLRADEHRAAAREYFDMARRLLEPPPPVVVAIGGRSGTGKSTLARDLAPLTGAPPGAAILRSDDVRKRMRGVAASTRLDATAYSAAASHEVYAALVERALVIARGGESVVVDATYLNGGERETIARAAAAAAVPFIGFWLDAPLEVLLARVAQRHDDASDADVAVVRLQSTHDAGAITWHPLDAASSPAQLVDSARAVMPAPTRSRSARAT